MNKPSLFTINGGTVKSYNVETKIAIVISEGEEIAISYDFTHSLVKGDCIFGSFNRIKDRYIDAVIPWYHPIKEPLIFLGRDFNTIKECFKCAFKYVDIPGGTYLTIYKCLEESSLLNKLRVDDYMDQYTDIWYRKKAPPVDFSIPEIDKSHFKVLIKWWLNNRLFRQLELLKVSREIIKKEKRNMIKMVHELMDNPLRIINLSLEEGRDIFSLIMKTPTKEQLIGGMLARKIRDHLYDLGCIYHPMSDSIKPYLEHLKINYNITLNRNGLYLPYPLVVETEVANYINKCFKTKVRPEHANSIINMVYENKNLTIEQRNAVKGSLLKPVSIVAGGAGVGKTTIIRELVYQIKNKLNCSCLITSFTGKAVARIKDILANGKNETDDEVFTMDRLIRTKFNIVPDYLIIDETSMVSTELFYRFISKLFTKNSINITLVGDVNQLSPIFSDSSWGNFFVELSKGNKIPIYYLKKNHRSDVVGINGIVINSEALVTHHQIVPYNNNFQFNTFNNFAILPGDINHVMKLVSLLIAKVGEIFKTRKLKIICPYNKPVTIINNKIRDMLLGHTLGGIQDIFKNKWFIGGLVMITHNFHEHGIMNGDEGIIVSINSYKRLLTVEFFNGVIMDISTNITRTDPDVLKDNNSKKKQIITTKNLLYSYAITVHKSQGSEYQYVIGLLPTFEDKRKFIDFNLIYTLITRARKTIWMICNKEQLDEAANIRSKVRLEQLNSRIN